MKKLYLLNNILIGLLLVAIWFIDYFYVRRISRKLSKSTIHAYNGLRAKIALRSPSEQETAKELCRKFPYHPTDTFYIDFVNFHQISDERLNHFAKLIKGVYDDHFENVHESFVYLRTVKVSKNELNSYIHKRKPIFKGAHLSAQNFYHIKLINEDFDNRINVKGNSVAIYLSTHKLAESDIFEKVIAKSLFHLKGLNRIDKVKGINFKSTDAFGKLKEVYYFCQRNRAVNHIASLNYINENKNLVFKAPYLDQLGREVSNLTEAFRAKKLREIYEYLRKSDLAIYDTIYFYEEY